MKHSPLGTCLHLVAPVLLMLISFAISMHDPSINPMEIVDSIQQGSRSVLLLATTPLSKRVLVIVSSPGNTVLDDDAIVFDQPLDSLTDTSMQLTYSAQYFKDKWPQLPRHVDSVGVLHDLDHEYLVVGYSKQLQLLNLGSVEDDVFSKNLDSGYYSRFFGRGRILLSSPHHMQVYSHFIDHGLEGYLDLKFLGSDLASNRPKQDDDPKVISSSFLIDFNATGGITFVNTKDPTWIPSSYITECPWSITAGYLTRSSVNLVDRNTSSIIQFDVSAFSQDGQASVNYTSIQFSSYWTFKPQATPPPPPPPPPTQAPIPPSKAPLFPINPTTFAPPPSSSEHTHNGNLAWIIALVVVFIILALGALAFFLFRKCRNAGKQTPLSPSEKLDPKRDTSQGKLVVNQKGSKRSSQGQSQQKGATPSRGASKGKVSKRSSGKPSPLKGSSSLDRVASSSRPSPLRRRRSTKRRAASPRHHHRHASLKQTGTIKPRHHSARKKRTPRPLTDYQKQTQAIAKLLI